jgi:transposase
MARKKPCPNCRRLAVENRQLKTDLQRLTARVAALEAELRRSKRQAAPFAKEKPKPDPKPPGRKPGHAPAFRATPPPQAVTETIRVPLTACPDCNGPVERIKDNQPIFQTDLPPITPVIRRFETQRGWCPRCRKMVRSRHPQQTSTAGGAARSHLGPRAVALAADLKHRLGLSFRKVADLFQTHFGVTVTPGALVQANQRLARRAEPVYQDLQACIRASPAVNADETGWRIGAQSAWLWVFATRRVTLYTIRFSRGHGVVEDILGETFPGTLISDGLPTYDPVRTGRKQQCLAHLLKRCRQIEAIKMRGAVRFPRTVARLLREAIMLASRRLAMHPHGFAVARGRLQAAMDRALRYHLADPDNERLAAHLFKHRDHLLTFLEEDAVDPTNNLAERQLRPAVIARKLSAGNRTERGARTHAILASLAATCQQQGQRFTDLATRLLCLHTPPPTLNQMPLPLIS